MGMRVVCEVGEKGRGNKVLKEGSHNSSILRFIATENLKFYNTLLYAQSIFRDQNFTHITEKKNRIGHSSLTPLHAICLAERNVMN